MKLALTGTLVGTRGEFRQNEPVQSWVVRHLQILGEAIRGLSPELRARHEDLPWSEIIGMRNVLWSVVEQDLPGCEWRTGS